MLGIFVLACVLFHLYANLSLFSHPRILIMSLCLVLLTSTGMLLLCGILMEMREREQKKNI